MYSRIRTWSASAIFVSLTPARSPSTQATFPVANTGKLSPGTFIFNSTLAPVGNGYLLDIEMPNMDGYEFATHVRNDARVSDVPIIMITSRVGDKHRARAIEIGVNDYLGKPYQDEKLLEAVQRLLSDRGIDLT